MATEPQSGLVIKPLSLWTLYSQALLRFILKTVIGAGFIQFIWNYAVVADFEVHQISFLTVFLILSCLHWWYNGITSQLKATTSISSNIYKELFYMNVALGALINTQYGTGKSSTKAPQPSENQEKTIDKNENT